MKSFWGRSRDIVTNGILFLAALATILLYFEQSSTPSKVGQFISSVVSPELLGLIYRLLLLLVVAIGFFRLAAMERRLRRVEEGWVSLEDGEHARLIIHSALYGLGSGHDLEVTERVRMLVTNGKLNIQVRPETFLIDDPYPNKVKSLRVACSYGDKKRVEVQRTDYQLLNLPYDIDP